MRRVAEYDPQDKIDVFQSMMEALPQSMFLMDCDKNIIGIFNATPESLAGTPVDDIIGANLLDFISDPYSPFFQACSMLNKTFDLVYKTGRTLTFEYVILDRCFEATISNISGNRILSQVRDITDIILKQQEVNDKKHKELAMAMTAGGLTSWSYDVGQKLFSSKHNNKVIGDEMPLDVLISSIDPEHRDVVVDMFDAIILRGEVHCNITVRVVDLVGNMQWANVHAIPYEYAPDGSVTLIVGSQKDVTADYEYNQRLKALIKQNELVLNNTNSGFVYLKPDMTVEWENASSIFTDQEVVCFFKNGRLCSKEECKRQDKCCRVAITQALETKERRICKLCTSGAMVVEIVAQPVLCDDGSVEGIVLRLDDITEKEHVLQELAEAKEQAEQSDKLKSAFLANMSHEIRTPLNSIVGFTQLIPEADDAEQQQEYIDVVNSNSEMLLNLINDILDLSKIEAGYFNCNNSIFDLSDLFSELELMFAHRKAAEVDIYCDLPQTGFLVNMDRMRIAQIITNFMTNAMKFTHTGYIRMGYEIIGANVRIFVEDTGLGMSEDEVKRVFVRFEKFNLFAQGTGLGTAIAKAIVDAYHGKIGAYSTLGVGSTFWVELPIGIGPLPDGQTPHSSDEPKRRVIDEERVSARILIAEDNDSNFRLVQTLLKKYDITRACNGAEAVDLMANGEFNMILMDMRMPVMDGTEATRRIRQNNKYIPIIAVTANAFEDDRNMAMEAGINEFLTKPLNKIKLLEIVDKYM